MDYEYTSSSRRVNSYNDCKVMSNGPQQQPGAYPQSPGSFASEADRKRKGCMILCSNSGAGSYQRTGRIGAIAIKNVRFAEQALLYPNDRSEEEVQRMWYQADELAEFKQQRRALVRELKRVRFDLSCIDQTHTSLRGYEPYFSMEINKATKTARQFVYHVIFNEQHRQRLLSVREPESMREISEQATEWARNNALELGYKDALECQLESLLFFQQKCDIH